MKLEVLEKNHYYHIFNRGINGESIFISDDNKKYFLKLLSKYLVAKISIFAYCLMDNYYHLIVRIDHKERMSFKVFQIYLMLMQKLLTSKITEQGVCLRNILKE